MCGEAGRRAGVTRAQCIGGSGSRLSALKNSLVRPPECFFLSFFLSWAKWGRESSKDSKDYLEGG